MKCEYCDECIYIGEGDYICDKAEPKIIITDHVVATEYYRWCKRIKRFKKKHNKGGVTK